MCKSLFGAFALLLLLCGAVSAQDGGVQSPLDVNVALGESESLRNHHGQSGFRTIQFELVGFAPRFFRRYDPSVHGGLAVTYSAVQEPQSWFGYDGHRLDWIRSETATGFLEHEWRRRTERLHPFVDVGTGIMWSNRRIPAATSRLNFTTGLTAGLLFNPRGRTPFFIAYRFAHDSNGGVAPRNPGLNVNGLFIGTRIGHIVRH